VVPGALLFPMLLWLAARCRPVFAAIGAFMVALTVVWTTIFGIGHFGDPNLPIEHRILQAQAVIMVVTVGSFVLAALFAERRDNERRLRRSEQHQRLLIAELDHRVKNVLAQVAAIATSTLQGSRSNDDFVRSLGGRIQSMAAAHTLLSKSAWQGVGLDALVRTELVPYTTGTNVKISGRDVTLTPAETQALSKVLHELATNAAKYGALSVPGGQVSVTWDFKPNGYEATLILEWRESGGPPVASNVQSSYGTHLIRDLIPHELGGTVGLAFASEGVNCRIEVPVKEV
jgi:two-component sensor histidine kinase